ncbi:hypothetical protein [Nocardia sp. alder85J]|uniref:hypothetical protein n=1 Tax=Nocardia sp. alder85J TaxID=2862949 RepID=UPI001CD58C88|nr:hypothetical protein [Nocardia sp. alder85J]MCX4097125.1 hypothetical protein [Nocardia sp. alder85J]
MVRSALGAAIAVVLAAAPAAAEQFGPAAPPNPWLGPAGTATMHGDAEASDTTPLPGPGTGPVAASYHPIGGTCPTILVGGDGLPVALCTLITTRIPTAFLLDPASGEPLASLPTRAGSGTVLGGVYAFLDHQDRLVTVDGAGNLEWIAHDHGGPGGAWRLYVDHTAPTSAVVPAGDAVSSATPDRTGAIWLATEHGTAAVLRPDGGIAAVALGAGELVENSIAAAAGGVAVATDHALYLLGTDAAGTPVIAWRQPYDRGPARKPGQLSHGTGATPTFFGPRTGSEYVTITDNAAPQEHLLVYSTATGVPICSVAVLPPGPSGTENSPIGIGNTVIVASTYGYPYPAGTVGPSDPASAPFTGGMTRVEVDPSGCTVRWNNAVPSAAVPRLSTADGKIYTFTRHSPAADATVLDGYDYAVIDAATGVLDTEQPVGTGLPFDTLEMVGSIAPGGVQYQGTVTGYLRVAAG